jgi:hypothetical protein
MQGEGNTVDQSRCWEEGSPTRSADCILPGSSRVINSTIHTSTASKSAPPALGGARCSDGRTRRYIRSSEPRLKWNAELHQCFVRAIEQLGGLESEYIYSYPLLVHISCWHFRMFMNCTIITHGLQNTSIAFGPSYIQACTANSNWVMI